MIVELMIYSGRHNPEWRMTEEQVNAFNDLLKTLKNHTQESLYFGLGYRGFLIKSLSDGERFDELIVYKHLVSDKKVIWQDLDRKLESWLLDTFKDLIPCKIY